MRTAYMPALHLRTCAARFSRIAHRIMTRIMVKNGGGVWRVDGRGRILVGEDVVERHCRRRSVVSLIRRAGFDRRALSVISWKAWRGRRLVLAWCVSARRHAWLSPATPLRDNIKTRLASGGRYHSVYAVLTNRYLRQ